MQPPHNPLCSVDVTTNVVQATLKEHVTIMVGDGGIDNGEDQNDFVLDAPNPPPGSSPRTYSSRHLHQIYLSLSTSGLQALAPAATHCDDNTTTATTTSGNNHYNYKSRQAPRLSHPPHRMHHDRPDNNGVGVRSPPNKRSRPSHHLLAVNPNRGGPLVGTTWALAAAGVGPTALARPRAPLPPPQQQRHTQEW